MDRFELCIGAFIILIIAGAFGFEYQSCEKYSELAGRNTEWAFFGGCFVQHGDKMIPQDEYKLVELKND